MLSEHPGPPYMAYLFWGKQPSAWQKTSWCGLKNGSAVVRTVVPLYNYCELISLVILKFEVRDRGSNGNPYLAPPRVAPPDVGAHRLLGVLELSGLRPLRDIDRLMPDPLHMSSHPGHRWWQPQSLWTAGQVAPRHLREGGLEHRARHRRVRRPRYRPAHDRAVEAAGHRAQARPAGGGREHRHVGEPRAAGRGGVEVMAHRVAGVLGYLALAVAAPPLGLDGAGGGHPPGHEPRLRAAVGGLRGGGLVVAARAGHARRRERLAASGLPFAVPGDERPAARVPEPPDHRGRPLTALDVELDGPLPLPLPQAEHPSSWLVRQERISVTSPRRPKYYAQKLREFGGFISPDYSLYADFTPSQKIWNTHRNYASGAWLQQAMGYDVIANVRTSGWDSIPYALAGAPKDTPIAIGSHGCLKKREDRIAFVADLEMVIDILAPSLILVYGTDAYGALDHPKSLGIPVKVFPSEMELRFGGAHGR